MTKLATRPVHYSGLTGGILEGREPDLTDRSDRNGTLLSATNLWHLEGGRLGICGGSKTQLTIASHTIDNVLGVWPFSPVGMIMIAHSTTTDKHYAYALTDAGGWALPVGTESEAGSTVDLGWNTTGAHRPDAIELFEKLYVVDATITSRQAMISLSVVAGSLTLTSPAAYDFNEDSTPGALKPYCCEAYNGMLLIAGTDSEAVTSAPAYVRHSFLGVEPGLAAGFDKDAYNIFGATGQWVRAMKQGNSICLVCKDNEIYRISGSGRAVPGWQLAVQKVDNTLGFGCSNPYALVYVNPYWYGLGTGGPWRTDGQTVESLLAPRLASWASVDKLEVAQVVFDPDRRCVLFGLHLATESAMPNYPFVFWSFQVDDGVWAPNRRFKSTRAFPMIRAIPQTAGAGPSTVPAGLTQSRLYGNMAYRLVEGFFTPGDLTAMTEVWTRPAGGASTLYATLAAGTARFSVVTYVPQQVKVRQVKAGVFTDFTDEVTMFPRLRTPFVTVGPRTRFATMQADIQNVDAGTVDLVFDATDGTPVYTNLDVPASVSVTHNGLGAEACITGPTPADFASDWEAWTEQSDWPTPWDVSMRVKSYSWAWPCGGANDIPPRVTQNFYAQTDALNLTSLTVHFRFVDVGWIYRVEYRLVGAGSYTVWSSESDPGATFAERSVTITGLVASSRYEVRLNNVGQGKVSLPTTCYTALAVPSIVATTNGSAGVPVVDLLIGAPYASADIQIYDQRDINHEILTGVSMTPATYTRSWGSDGVPNRIYARTYNGNWPEPFKFSSAVSDGITDPATVGV